eukprot:911106-Rhodomonas_salina.3
MGHSGTVCHTLTSLFMPDTPQHLGLKSAGTSSGISFYCPDCRIQSSKRSDMQVSDCQGSEFRLPCPRFTNPVDACNEQVCMEAQTFAETGSGTPPRVKWSPGGCTRMKSSQRSVDRIADSHATFGLVRMPEV